MRAIILMFDSLNRHMLPAYADTFIDAPNFARLAGKAVTFDNFYAGSLPCMPARRELHTGRHNFLHRSWGPLEPFDDSMPELLKASGVHTHLVSDHWHYWEDGGGTYHTRYNTWEFFRGQENDNWKGDVDALRRDDGLPVAQRQHRINRDHMRTEDTHSQTRTVNAGLDFLETNLSADDWMLQIELFDPHEPFFASRRFRDRYLLEESEDRSDWPAYGKVVETNDEVEATRREYAALVSMCDASLGRVLDFMDMHDMWQDTMLIVNTDHGFLLGEHGWWAKSVQPWFNELVHLPMFFWDPRNGEQDTRRGDLVQTIDIAPTLLAFFGIEAPEDMLGQDLALPSVRPGALFGIHGGHVNVTDGRYVYMRASIDRSNGPIEDFTLMPTHMRSRFSIEELSSWQQAAPFSFTKGLRTLRVDAGENHRINSWHHGTLLWDLQEDPDQTALIVDDEIEGRMIELLVRLLRENDAPHSLYARLGLPAIDRPGRDHLRVRHDHHRGRETAGALPPRDQLPSSDLLSGSVHDLVDEVGYRSVLERHAPWLVHTELVSSGTAASLFGMARTGAISPRTLMDIGEGLAMVDAKGRR